MRILLFTSNDRVRSLFGPRDFPAGRALEVRPPSELRHALGRLPRDCFVYVDVGARGEAEIGTIARRLSAGGLSYGFIDPADRIRDVALLFRLGASDYIGRRLMKNGLDPGRIRRAVEGFRGARGSSAPRNRKGEKRTRRGPARHAERGCAAASGEEIPPAVSWDGIEEGGKYLFCLMYIELDNLADFRRSLGEKNIQLTVKTFRDYAARSVAPYGGRIWMWNEFDGLALFPFDGERCDAVVPCLRLMLSMRIFSADLAFLTETLSYRIALHLGGTVYRRKGDTGGIVSDALNSVFHLGRKFLKPGNFAVTKAVYDRIPGCLRGCFVDAGEFEGMTVMRMRLPR